MVVLWIVLTLLVACVLSLNLHELSHCIVVWIYGGKVTEYQPYPHTKHGRFYLARMRWEGGEWTDKRHAARYAAPLVKSSLLLHLWIALAIFICPLFWFMCVPEVVDVGDWIKDYIQKDDSDGGRFRRIMNW